MLANVMGQRYGCQVYVCTHKFPSNTHQYLKHTSMQVRRLKMYNSGKAKRDKRGRIVKAADFQSKALPSTRIQPDRRWFGNTRVIGQKQLEQFKTAMADKV